MTIIIHGIDDYALLPVVTSFKCTAGTHGLYQLIYVTTSTKLAKHLEIQGWAVILVAAGAPELHALKDTGMADLFTDFDSNGDETFVNGLLTLDYYHRQH